MMGRAKTEIRRLARVALLGVTVTSLAAGPALAESCRSLRGVNLAGAEFGQAMPGIYNRDYTYPSAQTIRYFASHGASVIRLPFRWERLQRTLNGPFDREELARLKKTVATIKASGMKVILDPHNHARYFDDIIGSAAVPEAAFADFWRRMGREFAGQSDIIFSLANEPYDISARQWLSAANAALKALRATGATQLTLVPGIHYTGAHSWTQNLRGGNNGRIMRDVRDPANNFAFDVHQYLDRDFSGRNTTCPNARRAASALRTMTRWLQRTGNRAFLGEFGASSKLACLRGLVTMADYVNRNPDQWVGWAYWAAGDWWPEDNFMSVQPTSSVPIRPQFEALKPHLARPDCKIGKPLDLSLDALRR